MQRSLHSTYTSAKAVSARFLRHFHPQFQSADGVSWSRSWKLPIPTCSPIAKIRSGSADNVPAAFEHYANSVLRQRKQNELTWPLAPWWFCDHARPRRGRKRSE